MKTYPPIILAIICLLPTASFGEGAFEVGVSGAKIGDLGNSNGLEAGYRITPALRARLNYSSLNYQTSRSLDLFDASQTLAQKNAKLTLDWYPWSEKNGFYGSAGVIKLGSNAQLDASLKVNSINITRPDGTTVQYTKAALGKINGTIETNKTVPFAGIGYTHHFGSPSKSNGWYLQAEAGQIFDLNSKLKLTSTNPTSISSLPSDLQTYADQQNKLLEDSYALYGLTLGYRF